MEVKNIKETNIDKLFKVYPILKKINSEINNKLIDRIVIKNIEANEYLSNLGEQCIGFLFVIDGNIKIFKINENGDETNLYNIKSGELCHEVLSCFLNKEPLNIIGKALENSTICIIPFDVVEKILLKDIEFLQYVYRDLHEKFNIIISNKEQIKHESVDSRLTSFLNNSKSDYIYITHKELAFELDTAREVISRKLKEFEKRGFIALTRGKIKIIKNIE